MELKTYFKAFEKFKIFIISVAVIGGVIAYISASSVKSGYSLSQTFFLSSPKSQQTEVLSQNSDYFTQEKARNFTDSAISILDSSDFRSLVAGSGQGFSVRKLSPQVIRITTTSSQSQEAKELMGKIQTVFNLQISSLDENEPVSLKEIAPSKDPTFIKANRRVFTAAGVALGFALALFTVSLKIYFRL